MHTKPRSAAIYCRISEDRYGESLGVARQEKDCRRLAGERGWPVVDVYIDNDLSGSNRSTRRPEFERMLADATAGRIDAVIAWDFDRLTRQPRQLEALVDECAAAGVHAIVTVSDVVDFGTGDGLLVARIKGAVAAEEARKLSQRVRRKMLELAENGKPNGGRRPYGFDTNRVDHHPEETAALQTAAAAVLGGATITTAARPTGLRPESLKRILLSPRVAGLRQHQGEIIGPAVWAPIIDRADWERLRGVLDRPVRYSVPSKRHLLTGFARCGECGHALSAQWRKNPTRVIYQCRSARGGCGRVSVDGAHLEATVVAEVGRWLRSKKFLRSAQRHLDGGPDDDETALLQAIAEDEQRLIDLARQVGELRVSTVEWSAMRQPIIDRIDHARDRLTKTRRNTTHSIDLATVAAKWVACDPDQRRGWLQDLGVDVVVARAGRDARRFHTSRVRVIPSWAA